LWTPLSARAAGPLSRAVPEDPYVYPGTEVLRNKFNERDPERLREREYRATAKRAVAAPAFEPSAGGYKATHRHLFQDVFAWAGELRTTELAKGGSPFARQGFVEAALQDRFRQVDRLGGFKGIVAVTFAVEAAHHISELNAIHPFREGNGRTMRLHLEQIAELARHTIDYGKMDGASWVKASIAAFQGDEQPLARLIGTAIGLSERDLGRVRDAASNGHGR